jgi:hypothetical protein
MVALAITIINAMAMCGEESMLIGFSRKVAFSLYVTKPTDNQNCLIGKFKMGRNLHLCQKKLANINI